MSSAESTGFHVATRHQPRLIEEPLDGRPPDDVRPDGDHSRPDELDGLPARLLFDVVAGLLTRVEAVFAYATRRCENLSVCARRSEPFETWQMI